MTKKLTAKKIKIIFISRAYPPVRGGIETQNWELSRWLPQEVEIKTIANRRGKFFLPIFASYAFLKTCFLLPRYDAVLLGDGTLAIVGWILKIIFRKPVISIVHGLDLTYPLWLYQKYWVKFFLKKMDKLIAVGNETIRQGISHGLEEKKFVFVPNGINPDQFTGNFSRADLEKITGLNLENKKIVLTLGRLTKRKGVAWFVEKVVPLLDKNILYFVVGEGKDKENIRRVINKNKLENRVKLFHNVSDDEKKILFNTVDIFVQPNIKIPNDIEGFGIAVLEAASAGRVVVASRLEGLQDAVKNGENGFLVEPENAERFAAKINALIRENELRRVFGQRARAYTRENYSWEKIVKKYADILRTVIEK